MCSALCPGMQWQPLHAQCIRKVQNNTISLHNIWAGNTRGRKPERAWRSAMQRLAEATGDTFIK